MRPGNIPEKIRKIFCTVAVSLFLFSSVSVNAQNVAINTTGATAVPSAMLDMSGTTYGFLIPRMTHAQMMAIPAPATSLLVYSSNDYCFYYYNGTVWQPLHCTCLGAPVMNVTGNVAPCQGSSQTYSATLVSGSNPTSYIWSFPAGTVITAGQGTSTVTVTWGAASGNASLTASNTCGAGGGTLPVAVNPILTAPTPISGSTALDVCAAGVNYSVPTVIGALTYTWNITPAVAGTGIVSGQGTNSVYFDFGATPATYTLTVHDSNACGVSANSQLIVTTTVQHGTITYTTAGHYPWVVPCGISSITITMFGAGGGRGYHGGLSGAGGKGAKVVATLAVVAGTTINYYVGDKGGNATANTIGGDSGVSGNAGDESGGMGYGSANTATWGAGGGGGGASSVRVGGTALANRVLVAGGGGGAGRVDNNKYAGGEGGQPATNGGGANVAEDGKQGTSGVGGASTIYNPALVCLPGPVASGAGALGCGGNGGMTNSPTCNYGGGGGGGGGDGGGSGGCGGGGGGGYTYTAGAGVSAVTVTSGNHAGVGGISFTY